LPLLLNPFLVWDPVWGRLRPVRPLALGWFGKVRILFSCSGPSLASSSLVPFDSQLWLAFLRLCLVPLGPRHWIHGEPSSVAPPSPIDSLQAWTPWLQCGCLGWVPPLRVSASSPTGIVGLSLFFAIFLILCSPYCGSGILLVAPLCSVFLPLLSMYY